MKKPEDEGTRTYGTAPAKERGTGPNSAGQSGDTQGLSDLAAESGDESVEELVEEGQFYEAEVVAGVARAREPGPVRTTQVTEEDVPLEYQDDSENDSDPSE